MIIIIKSSAGLFHFASSLFWLLSVLYFMNNENVHELFVILYLVFFSGDSFWASWFPDLQYGQCEHALWDKSLFLLLNKICMNLLDFLIYSTQTVNYKSAWRSASPLYQKMFNILVRENHEDMTRSHCINHISLQKSVRFVFKIYLCSCMFNQTYSQKQYTMKYITI